MSDELITHLEDIWYYAVDLEETPPERYYLVPAELVDDIPGLLGKKLTRQP